MTQKTMTFINLSVGQIAISRLENYANRPTIVFLYDSLGRIQLIQLWRDFREKLAIMASSKAIVQHLNIFTIKK